MPSRCGMTTQHEKWWNLGVLPFFYLGALQGNRHSKAFLRLKPRRMKNVGWQTLKKIKRNKTCVCRCRCCYTAGDHKTSTEEIEEKKDNDSDLCPGGNFCHWPCRGLIKHVFSINRLLQTPKTSFSESAPGRRLGQPLELTLSYIVFISSMSADLSLHCDADSIKISRTSSVVWSNFTATNSLILSA